MWTLRSVEERRRKRGKVRQSRDPPCIPLWDSWAPLLPPMEVTSGADAHLQPVEDPCQSRRLHPKKARTFWEEAPAVVVWCWETATCETDPHQSSSGNAAAHGKDSHRRKFVEYCLLWERHHTGAREECKESSSWGGRSSKTDWTPHSLPPLRCCGEGGREIGSKAEPGKKRRMGGRCS